MTFDAPPLRLRALEAFLVAAGWAEAERALLAGDASFRKYYRLQRLGPTKHSETAVLMDAPPERENVAAFVHIDRALSARGFSTPEILFEDIANGFLLLEDWGDETFTRLLNDHRAPKETLYTLAVETLIALHKAPLPEALPPYTDAKLIEEASLLAEWFLPAVEAPVSDAALEEWRAVWRALLPVMRGVPEGLVMRDFHAENLMLVPGRDGIKACGLLDFQDAVLGPPSYDLLSLLEDARRDVSPEMAERLKARYLAARPDLDPIAFAHSFATMAAQRHAKVIGLFARLWRRDGKPKYLHHIPRVWRLLEAACTTEPALAEVRAWLDRYAPASIRERKLQ